MIILLCTYFYGFIRTKIIIFAKTIIEMKTEKYSKCRCLFTFFLLFTLFVVNGGGFVYGDETHSKARLQVPSKVYGNLFFDVMNCDSLFMRNGLFTESKTFVDIKPKFGIDTILRVYKLLPERKNCTLLANFINEYFSIPDDNNAIVMDDSKKDIDEYIKSLWTKLQRFPNDSDYGTLIPLNHPYFVPGGRFREVYYWDSYFSMLGMACDKEYTLMENIVDNFAGLIHTLGFIPNGNRTYYLGRSQPPFFAQMVELLAQVKNDDNIYTKYLPYMQQEHDYWMQGADSVNENKQAFLHVVRMPDGTILNRYYDIYDTPREEMYRNDVETGSKLAFNERDLHKLYRNLRSAAESGYDFSSRWMKDGKNLYSTRTTEIVPVDLNTYMYMMEAILSKAYKISGDNASSERYSIIAEKRKIAIEKYFWDKNKKFYFDYVWTDNVLSNYYNLSGIVPLYGKVASKEHAAQACSTMMRVFLKPGGLEVSPYNTGQQWDAPNGWAPLQWMAYKGLRNYGLASSSDTIRHRWMNTCEREYYATGNLKEKYNVEDSGVTSGGEYTNQTGFGWTNGVYRAMKCNLSFTFE